MILNLPFECCMLVMCALTSTTTGGFKFGDFLKIRQIAKLKPSPKFSVISTLNFLNDLASAPTVSTSK